MVAVVPVILVVVPVAIFHIFIIVFSVKFRSRLCLKTH